MPDRYLSLFSLLSSTSREHLLSIAWSIDQIVYPVSALSSKCFLVSTLIGSFNLCFHLSFSVPLSDQNYECLPQKSQCARICWYLAWCEKDFWQSLQQEERVLTYIVDSSVLLLNIMICIYVCMCIYIYIYIYIYNNVKLKGLSGNCCIFLHALIWDSKKPSLSFILPSATNLTYFVLNQNCKWVCSIFTLSPSQVYPHPDDRATRSHVSQCHWHDDWSNEFRYI